MEKILDHYILDEILKESLKKGYDEAETEKQIFVVEMEIPNTDKTVKGPHYGLLNVLAAKMNSYIDITPHILSCVQSEDIKYKDVRWLRNLHKLKTIIDVVKANIPQNLEQNPTQSQGIDMKQVLFNTIDNIEIFCDNYLSPKKSLQDTVKLHMSEITLVTQSCDIALQMIGSVDEKKIISLVSNMYLTFRETLELIPDEIIDYSEQTEEITEDRTMKDIFNGAIKAVPEGEVVKPIDSNVDAIGNLAKSPLGAMLGALASNNK